MNSHAVTEWERKRGGKEKKDHPCHVWIFHRILPFHDGIIFELLLNVKVSIINLPYNSSHCDVTCRRW